LALLLLALHGAGAQAQQIYKSVDAQGHVVYSDQADPSLPQTPVELAPNAASPPDQIHVCWTNCFTLKWDNGAYRRTDGTQETWTIERFAPPSVILHRHDAPAAWNGNSTDVTYEGQLGDGRLGNFTVNGRAVPEINMSWGAALDELPADNADRDRRNWAPARPPVFAPNAQPPDAIEPGVGGTVSASIAPPPLEEDTQPECDVDGELWTPGYWGWGGSRYYWVPGAWIHPPGVGLLWTPGYWAYSGASFTFFPGYWGPHVGYYGGINYGFGYFGEGYSGGRWVGNSFAYNRTVNALNLARIHNVYSENVARPGNAVRVSYNGGPGGTTARPSVQDRAAAVEPHIVPGLRQQQSAPLASHPTVSKTATNNAVHSNNGAEPKPKVARAGATSSARSTPTAAAAPSPKERAATRPERAPAPAAAQSPDAGKDASVRKAARSGRP
jgi:hypothetical protein